MTASIYPIHAAPPTSIRQAWIDVDLAAIRYNAERLRARAGAPLVAMVKADAYGLGAVAVARTLGATFSDSAGLGNADLQLVWGLGIATIAEARELREAGCLARLLCCTPLLPEDLVDAAALDVTPSLHTATDIQAWAAIQGGAWHLSIDTGIARAGIRWDRVAELRAVLQRCPPEGVFTHFHSAEEPNGSRELQEVRFAKARDALADVLPPNLLIHSDNSAAIAARADARGVVHGASDASLVRPGIALYGAGNHVSSQLRQVFHLRARIVDLRDVHAGESVGYGATWSPTETRRIATVPVGYADGYRRHLSNRGDALLHGQRCPVVGRISMDMTTVDVTGISCAIGDVLTLIGTDGAHTLTTDAVAKSGDLSPYELLVGMRLRLPRLYSPAPLTTS